MFKFSTKIRVEFYDTDALGVVWHGNYINFLERARCDFLDFVGYDYYQMGKDGFTYPIIKLDIKYIKPAYFKDELEVEVILVEFESFFRLNYIIKNAKTSVKIATASTSQAAVKVGNKTLEFETPLQFQKAFRRILK